MTLHIFYEFTPVLSLFFPAGFWVLLLPSLAVDFNSRLDKLSNPIHLQINTELPIPVTTRSKAWSAAALAGVASSNPAGGMGICLLWVLCVVRKKSLRRAHRSSRGALPSVVCVSEWDSEAAMRPWPTRGPLPPSQPKKKSCMGDWKSTTHGCEVSLLRHHLSLRF